MPLQKAFTLNGNPIKTTAKEVVFLIIGLIGGFLLLFEFVKLQPAFLLIGRGLLLISAVYFRLTYFIAMQLILLASYGGIYLGIGSTLTLILPILLSFQLLIYYLLSGELKSVFRFIGIAGIAILSIGLTLNIPLILLFGNLSVGIYSYYAAYQGQYQAIIWGILNTLFVIDICITFLIH